MRIENCDCVEGMKRLADNSIDLTVTSPPYDNIRTYNGFSFNYMKTLDELYRVTKDGGVVVWIVADQTINGSETGTSFKQALYAISIGFNLHDTMIWKKSSCAFPEVVRYYPVFEYMFVFSKGKPKTVNLIEDRQNKWGGTKVHGTFRQQDGEMKSRSTTWKNVVCKDFGARFNVWEIPENKNNDTGHPATFPVQLVVDHIKSWSERGNIVLDPFMGSGTTGIACIETGREFIGFEISKEYFEGAKKRIDDASAQIRMIL